MSDALTRCARAGNPREWFNVNQELTSCRRWRTSSEGEAGFDSYLRNVLRVGRTRNGVWGVKLHYYQFAQLAQRLRQHRCYSQNRVADALSTLFPNLKYIWLRREDRLRQAISLYRALNTGRWWKLPDRTHKRDEDESTSEGDVKFDGPSILALKTALEKNDLAWGRYFDANRISPLVVHYENLVRAYECTILHILQWLAVPEFSAARITSPRFLRQADSLTETFCIQYLDFEARLQPKNEPEQCSTSQESVPGSSTAIESLPDTEPSLPLESPIFARTRAFRAQFQPA